MVWRVQGGVGGVVGGSVESGVNSGNNNNNNNSSANSSTNSSTNNSEISAVTTSGFGEINNGNGSNHNNNNNNNNNNTISSSNAIVSPQELIYNAALRFGKEGAVQQLMHKVDDAKKFYKRAKLLIEALSMEQRVDQVDRLVLVDLINGFDIRMKELQQQQQMAKINL